MYYMDKLSQDYGIPDNGKVACEICNMLVRPTMLWQLDYTKEIAAQCGPLQVRLIGKVCAKCITVARAQGKVPLIDPDDPGNHRILQFKARAA